jgi:hypothetical protein
MEKLGERLLESWSSGQNVTFQSSEAKKLYEERTKRIVDAIKLEVPDRVPIAVDATFFNCRYAGITFEEAMYDWDKAYVAWKKMVLDFGWDATMGAGFMFPGLMYEALDFKQLKWPGHGVDKSRSYQFVEGEYMTADEYDAFLDDPSDFTIRTYLPRISGALEPFQSLPPLHDPFSYYQGICEFAYAFSTPEMASALEALKEAGRVIAEWYDWLGGLDAELAGLGYPVFIGSWAHAPFDRIGNYFRGTRGIMIDMFRNPDKLLEALERVLPWEVQYAVSLAEWFGNPIAAIFLHKGSKGFMSEEQFKTFYWPTLRELMLRLIDQGLIPLMYTEGDYTPWLEIIKDIPAGKAIYHFEHTDIFKAKEVLGDRVCITGNVPNELLCLGTPREVKDYCKKLIDVVGKGGGFIMDADAEFMDAKIENIRVMTEFTKEYGVYKR